MYFPLLLKFQNQKTFVFIFQSSQLILDTCNINLCSKITTTHIRLVAFEVSYLKCSCWVVIYLTLKKVEYSNSLPFPPKEWLRTQHRNWKKNNDIKSHFGNFITSSLVWHSFGLLQVRISNISSNIVKYLQIFPKVTYLESNSVEEK